VISRRWLLSGSSVSPLTISSASWGRKKRLSRRAVELRELLLDPLREVRFQSASSSCSTLIRSSDLTRARSLGLVDGLAQEVVAPASIPSHAPGLGSSAVTMMIAASPSRGSPGSSRKTS